MSSAYIRVGNLDESIHDRDLMRLFAAYGTVRSARVATHADSGRSTGVGFVEMESEAEADAAIAALHGREHAGRTLSASRDWNRKDPDADQHQMFGPMNMPSGQSAWPHHGQTGPNPGDFGDRGGSRPGD